MRIGLLIILILMISTAFAGEEYSSALLVEARSGQVLFEDQADRLWSPASVTKLMLMLLADDALREERLTSETPMTCSAYAQSMGGSQVFLAEGDQLPFEKLMECVAVASANDAAVVVAEGLFGSTDACVAAMNAQCVKLGMNSTHYVNVNGLPENHGGPENVTTARDQAILAREVLTRHTGVLDWTRIQSTEFRPGHALNTTNTMMRRYEGMDGLKTGYHAKGMFNLVATAERDGRRLIAVVFGSPGARIRNRVVERLLDSGFRDWDMRMALKAGDRIGAPLPVKRTWRGKLRACAGQDLVYLAKPADISRVIVELEKLGQLKAPIMAGQIVGRIVARLDGKVISAVPAIAEKRVRATWPPWPAR